MSPETTIIASITAMCNMGAKLVRIDKSTLFFEVPRGCKIDDDDKLKRAADLLFRTSLYHIKIKRTEQH